ncbi:MFS transporter [Heyndrickxia acidicola]|uniref:MFS transporter n=1 Tax=Heyndrickxia acidicola TaxID=209389 RepID=A0ABU6MJR1_9BACI|nr:MFS transporter [Heyndrickxia acidicola]MED1204554.1 MFS transporter [Heyndrickxia acidicola]
MAEKRMRLDDAPLNKFHLKITALTFGAHFTDAYALGIISIALVMLTPQMHLTPIWVGLIGSSALIGIFIGSLLLGWLSDRIGRQKIFIFNFLLITVATFLQFFVHNAVELFILRVLIGIGLGGDYTVGVTMLAEFAPRKYRGSLLGSLEVMWAVGYAGSTVLGYFMQQSSPDSWRWMLVSGTIPSLIVLLMRIGTPESPRWLISKGRRQEANQIITKHIGPNIEVDETEVQNQGGFSKLFNKNLRIRTAIGSLFFVCLVIPYFAIYTFLPSILTHMGFKENFLTDLVLNIFLIIGAIFGIWCTDKFSRRGFLIGSFAILTVCLFLLSVLPSGSSALLITCFIIFTIVMSAVCNLTAVYTAELFPTDVRASGIGFVTAISRVGSAAGTFFLPTAIANFGVAYSMLGLTLVLLIGMITSIAWAPETKTLTLSEASNTETDKVKSQLKDSKVL